MRALVAGLGSAGCRHANNLHALDVELAFYRERGLPPPVPVAASSAETFSNYEQALASRPNLVVIATPSSLHFRLVKAALLARIPVYVEKPLTTDLAEARELRDLARKESVPAQLGCQLRFHPQLLQIKAWLCEDRIGKIYSAFADVGEWLPGWHPWEDYRASYAARAALGGGVLHTYTHELDYLSWLLGPVEKVACFGGKRSILELDVEDHAELLLRHQQGMASQVRMDFWRRPPVRQLHLSGERGQIFWDYYAKSLRLTDETGKELVNSQLPPGWERNQLFLDSMKYFLGCVKSGERPSVGLEEGAYLTALALAAQGSMRETRLAEVKEE